MKPVKRVTLAAPLAEFIAAYAQRNGLSESQALARAVERGTPVLASEETAILINEKTRRRLQTGALD
jgi:hypothetical protein